MFNLGVAAYLVYDSFLMYYSLLGYYPFLQKTTRFCLSVHISVRIGCMYMRVRVCVCVCVTNVCVYVCACNLHTLIEYLWCVACVVGCMCVCNMIRA